MTDETINDLDSILEGNESEPEQVESGKDAAPEDAEPGPDTSEPDTEEAKGEETEDATSEEAETPAAEEEESWTKPAVLDERRKRQSAEDRANKAEQELARLQQGDSEKAEEKSVSQLLLEERINMSIELMKTNHTDYQEKEDVFVELANKNPALYEKMNASPNPASFAYNTANNHLEANKLSDPTELEKMKAKIREEVLAEVKKEESPEDKRKKSAVEVPNLTGSTSTKGGTSTTQDVGLEEIFPQ